MVAFQANAPLQRGKEVGSSPAQTLYQTDLLVDAPGSHEPGEQRSLMVKQRK